MRIVNKKSDNEKELRIEFFDSLGEFVRYARDNDFRKSSDKPYEKTFHGPHAESLDSACKLAAEGWSELRPQVDGVLVDVTERLADRLSDLYKPTYDFGGAYVDMGRFVEGEPECMVSFASTTDTTTGRVIKVAVAGTASHYIEADWLLRRGVAILALIDTINKLGFGVELWWDSSIHEKRNSKSVHTTAVKLHDSADTLDINSVMFALAHPSMLRRLTFSVQERSETAKAQGVGAGYGYPNSMGLLHVDNFDVTIEKLQDGSGDIVNDPMAWVMSTLKGLELIPETV